MNKQAKSLMFASIALLLISIVVVCFVFAIQIISTMNGQTNASIYYTNALNNVFSFNITTPNADIEEINFTASLTLITYSTDVPRVYSITNSTVTRTNVSFNSSTENVLISLGGSQLFIINATAAADGRANINFTTLSSGGSLNTTQYSIEVDTAKPNVTILKPANNANIATRLISINTTAEDVNLNYTNISVLSAAGVVVASSFNNTSPYSANATFNLTTDGRYVINISAFDKAGNQNTTNITILVDTTGPAVVLNTPPVSGVATNSTGIYLLNATVTDTGVGTLGAITFNFSNSSGLVNTTVAELVDGAYTNSTGFILLNYSEGAYTLRVNASDSLGNGNTTTVSTFYIDRTPPTSITAAALSTAQTVVNFSITINDSTKVGTALGSGVNTACTSSAGTVSGTTAVQGVYQSGLICNTAYTYTISCQDKAGNINTTGTYTVTTSACDVADSPSGGGLPSSAMTYSVSLASTGAVASRSLRANDGLKFTIENVSHSVTVKSLSAESVVVTIASTPIDATIKVGETKKFDLNSDGIYDLAVKYNGVLNTIFAKIAVTSISETMTAEEVAEQTAAEEATAAAAGEEEKAAGMSTTAIIGIIVAILVIAGIAWYLMKKK